MPRERRLRASEQNQINAAKAVLRDPKAPRFKKKAASRTLAKFGLNSPKAGKTSLRRSPTLGSLSELPGAAAVLSMPLASAAAASPSSAEHASPAAAAPAAPAPEAASSGDSVTALADTLQILDIGSGYSDTSQELQSAHAPVK